MSPSAWVLVSLGAVIILVVVAAVIFNWWYDKESKGWHE